MHKVRIWVLLQIDDKGSRKLLMSSQRDTILLKQTPFVFLKALFIIEFFFALLPVTLAILFNLAAFYQDTPLAGFFSYNLFSIIALTTLQTIILAIAFVLWYLPEYKIDAEKIIHRRHNLMNDRELANAQSIQNTAVHFGPIGKRLNYGNIQLSISNTARPVKLKNLASPQQVKEQIDTLLKWETAVAPLPDALLDKPLPQLIGQGEGQHVEFKASFLWDYKRGNANKNLNTPVLKNIAAFMNTDGGILLIGVSDDGELLGLEPDFKLLKKQDADGWENNFNMAFNHMIGPEFRQYVSVKFESIDGKIISVLTVRSSPKPVYLNANGKEDFYIKTGNASQPLTVRQAANYIQAHFNK